VTVEYEQHEGVEPIAVIGMACRVPGARTPEEFWGNMRDGVESVTRFTEEELLTAGVDAEVLRDPDYVPASAVIEGADEFDAAFFGYNPREAETMDPQQRIFVECAWEALEHSGHNPRRTEGNVGVFAGTFMNKYLTTNLNTNARFLRSPMAPLARIFNDKDFLATRVAHLLNLTGPAYTLQTACSTSLVATHVACQSLLSYESDVALVGGVAINVPLKAGYPIADGGLFSGDGHCRPFDVASQGTVPGNGAVVVVLRRLFEALADRDHVYAVIRGSAVNNDGAHKAGFTAPSVDGQAAVIAAAQALAGVGADTIGYLEAHGTATQVGDPIEVAALTQAFQASTQAQGYCALGSVKANIGHLDAAAGAAGLLRTVLALSHSYLPPSINFTSPNPEVKLEQTPFYVPTTGRQWQRGATPRRAGVSSFGVGGTNAHVVVEEAPEPEPAQPERPWQLVTLSARTRSALDTATRQLAEHLERHPDTRLGDVAFTLREGRHDFDYRRFAVCADTADATATLRGDEPERLITKAATAGERKAVFMFPGGGTQHRDMGLDIYRAEPLFRAEVDRCAELLQPRLGFDLRTLLFPTLFPGGSAQSGSMGRADGPAVVSALFVTEYALAKLWMSWGVEPEAMVGHSLGEYVAACLAGVFSLPDALAITLARGEIFAQMPPGSMLVVPLPEDEVRPLLDDQLSISAVNAPGLTVVAGPDEAIAALDRRLVAADVEPRRINVPVASHSWMVEPYLADFARTVAACELKPPTRPFVSCVTGTWIRPEEATDPGYWVRHLREPVRFAAGIREVLAAPGRVLLEVGPGNALSSLAAAQRLAPAPVAVPSMRHPRDPQPDLAFLVGAAGRLWQAGVDVVTEALHGDARPRRVPLPTYPFERRRHWIAPGRTAAAGLADDVAELDEPLDEDSADDTFLAPRTEREAQVARVWCDLLGLDRVSVDDDFFELGAHSLMVTQMTKELRRLGAVGLTARQVFRASTVAAQAALLDGGQGAVAVAGPDLAAEVVLDPLITAEGLPAPAEGSPRVVLLTGATGFVGAYLAAELAKQTKAQVLCLVRAGSVEEGTDRLRSNLESYGLRPAGLNRIRALPGDLAKPLLGLGQDEFDTLAGQVDAVYHCGAWVNFVRPYRALKATNVLGTQEVLRLATTTRLKPVHHISTLAVLAGAVAAGAMEILEDDPLPPPVGHDTSYSESKWVAEGLVELARSRGVPVSVYRAGGVLSDSQTGATNSEDYVTKVIQGCVQLGLAPLRNYALSVGTVDHLARTVVGLSLRAEALGRTFHTIDPQPLAWNRIFAEISDFGFDLRSVPWDEWRSALTSQVEEDDTGNALAPLMAMLGDVPDRDMPRMDCGNVLAAGLPDALAAPPALDAEFFARMLRFFVHGGWLPPVDAHRVHEE